MKKSVKILLIGLGVVVAGGAVYGLTRPKTTYETEKITRGTVISEVSVTGSIAPSSKISLQPEVSGKITKIAVKEGAEVKEGDLLIQLDTRDASARVASQQAAVASARARLRELQAGATAADMLVSQTAVEAARQQYTAAVAAEADAETALTNARRSYENVKARTTTQDEGKVSALQDDYDSASTTASDAVNRLTSPMFDLNDLLLFSSSDSQSQSDATSTRREAKTALTALSAAAASARAVGGATGMTNNYDAVVNALTAVKRHADACAKVLQYAPSLPAATLSTYQINASTAQSSLNAMLTKVNADKSALDLQERLNATDITAAEIAVSNAESAVTSAAHAVDSATAAVNQAEASYNLKKTGSRPEEIDAQRAQVASAEATLASLQADLAKRSIRAPLTAIVTDLPFNPGETVQPGQVAVTLNAKDRFEITANISEVDIARVKVNDPVNITLDAFSVNEIWTGKVISIQPAEKVVEGVIFYETKIVFDKDDERLRSGMTANLDISTAQRDNVLRVPVRAIKDAVGKKTVQVLVNGQPVTKDIQVGLENNDYVELLSGLAEGDEVVVATNKK
ncbi:MAG: efflux RND transporter periplasmic adaptor subunit [Patescibacteria group bacterium]|nr:efflux RND transporter periplasmic adaptor subunit [Patescibacteria group bacterium]